MKLITSYPTKGSFKEESRRTLNADIVRYVDILIDIYPGYSKAEWYKKEWTDLTLQGDFGTDTNQLIQAQLCILGCHVRGSTKQFYEELLEWVPYLKDYLTVTTRGWTLTAFSKEENATKEHKLSDEDKDDDDELGSPTKKIEAALTGHGNLLTQELDALVKVVEGQVSAAEDDEDSDDETVHDFNNRTHSFEREDKEENEEAKNTPTAQT